jgi:hypothetical protein
MFRKYLLSLLVLALLSSVWVIQHYDLPYPKPLGPIFDAKVKQVHLHGIESAQPEVVLLGDSTLQLGVDAGQLSSALGHGTYKVSIPGSASAIWYLALKNVILESSYKPTTLVLFFRGTLLTRPDDRVTGRYFALVDELAGRHEPLVTQLSYVQQMSPVEKIMDRYFPLFGNKLTLKDGIEYRPRYGPTVLLLNCDKDCADASVNSLFVTANLQPEVAHQSLINAEIGLYGSGGEDFAHQVERFYLPEIIRLCQKNGIRLILVHTPTLVYPTRDSEPEFIRRYLADLQTWLEARGVTYLDFYYDPRITSDMYQDAVHMNERGKVVFTEALAEALKPILK